MSTEEGDKLHVVTADDISNNKKRLGKFLVWGSAIILAFTLLIQALDTNSYLTIDLETWRPSLICICFLGFLFVCFSGFNSWRAWKTSFIRIAGRALRHFYGGIPTFIRISNSIFRLEPIVPRWPNF